MEGMQFAVRTAGMLAALYVALVIELSFPGGEAIPSAIALATTVLVCLSRTRAAVFWAAAGGFAIDASSTGRLGPFVMAHGIIASVFLSVAPAARRTWWFGPSLAFAFAACAPLVIGLLARIEETTPMPPTLMFQTAVTRGLATACAATVGLMLLAIAQRLCSPARSHEPLTLSNRWTMITE